MSCWGVKRRACKLKIDGYEVFWICQCVLYGLFFFSFQKVTPFKRLCCTYDHDYNFLNIRRLSGTRPAALSRLEVWECNRSRATSSPESVGTRAGGSERRRTQTAKAPNKIGSYSTKKTEARFIFRVVRHSSWKFVLGWHLYTIKLLWYSPQKKNIFLLEVLSRSEWCDPAGFDRTRIYHRKRTKITTVLFYWSSIENPNRYRIPRWS